MNLVRAEPIFTTFEFDRKVPLMFTLNIMCTYLTGYYQQNNKVRKFLEDRAIAFPERDEVISVVNDTAVYIDAMNFPPEAMWWNKSNFFTLVSELSRQPDLRNIAPEVASEKLLRFQEAVPDNYALAAREAVSRRGQREYRGKVVREILAG
jgi:hypothetical protein